MTQISVEDCSHTGKLSSDYIEILNKEVHTQLIYTYTHISNIYIYIYIGACLYIYSKNSGVEEYNNK